MVKAKNVDSSFEKLQQFILTEDFQQCLSYDIATHLSDKKLDRVDEAAVINDSYNLTHVRNFHEMKNTRPSKNYKMKATARSVTRPLFPPQTRFVLGPFSRQKMVRFHSMPGKDSPITCAFCKKLGSLYQIVSN